MGTSESKPQNRNYLDHPLFGKVTLDQSLQNEYHCVTIQIVRVLPHFSPVDKWLNSLKQNIEGLSIVNDDKQYTHIFFGQKAQQDEENYASLLIPIKYSWKNEGLCGQGGVLKIQFQAFMFSLQQEIKNRINEGKYFLQTQVWFLLYKLIELEKQFEEIDKKIGNLHPKNILINDDGQIKVFSQLSSIDGMDNFEEKLQNISAHAFLAPEQIHGVNNRQQLYVEQVNENKSQMFSLGLTILCAATLSLGEEFYTINEEFNTLEISLTSIQQKLKSLGQHYSSFLYSVVQSMIKLKPMHRREAGHIYDSLKQYESQILNLHPFLPNQSEFNRVKRQKSLQQKGSQYQDRFLQYHEVESRKQLQQRRLNNFYQKFKY